MNQKYNYYLSQAVEKRNPNLCNNVEGYDQGDYQYPKKIMIDECKARYGGRIGDVDYCSKLDSLAKYGTATQQSICFSVIADQTKDIQICDRLPMMTHHDVNVRYKCYARIAEENKDVTICQIILEQGYDRTFYGSRFNCLVAVGKKLKSASACQYLADTWVANECIRAIGFSS